MKLNRAYHQDQIGLNDQALLSHMVSPYLRLLLIVLASFLFAFGAWSCFAPLASAAIANGRVSTEGNHRIIQHLEGGIVREIYVAEGSRVEQGDPLVSLDATKARAQFLELQTRAHALAAREDRLEAELSREALVYRDVLANLAEEDEEIRRILDDQTAQFDARRSALQGRKDVLEKRGQQVVAELRGLVHQRNQQQLQLETVQSDTQAITRLVEDEVMPQRSLRAAHRDEARWQSQLAGTDAAIARAEQARRATDLQIEVAQMEVRDEVTRELSTVRTDLLAINERLLQAKDVLERTEVIAPVAGVVTQLMVHTAGGVVESGDPLMHLVADREKRVINARVRPEDIDVVYIGLPARVRITAYRQRNRQPLHGSVMTVSADRLSDERDGGEFFLATIQIPNEELERARVEEGVELRPGMPAEVMIVTGESTLAQYLLDPLRNSARRAFRED